MLDKTTRAHIEALPEFTDDATDRLRHTLAAFDNTGNAEWAIRATVINGETTGLTWGDLRGTPAQTRRLTARGGQPPRPVAPPPAETRKGPQVAPAPMRQTPG